MSNANTRNSSLAVYHVNRRCNRIAVSQALNTHTSRWIKSNL